MGIVVTQFKIAGQTDYSEDTIIFI